MVIMKHQFKGHINANDVRHFCIQCGLFTCGDNEQYGEMLNKCGIIDADQLLGIATDIYQFSDWATIKSLYGAMVPKDAIYIDDIYIESIARDLMRYVQFFFTSYWLNEEGKVLD